MIARRKGSHAGAGHVKYLHFVVICVTRCIYNKSAKLKRHDRKSFHNLKRKGISGSVGGERFEMPVVAYKYHLQTYLALSSSSKSMELQVYRSNIRHFSSLPPTDRYFLLPKMSVHRYSFLQETNGSGRSIGKQRFSSLFVVKFIRFGIICIFCRDGVWRRLSIIRVFTGDG